MLVGQIPLPLATRGALGLRMSIILPSDIQSFHCRGDTLLSFGKSEASVSTALTRMLYFCQQGLLINPKKTHACQVNLGTIRMGSQCSIHPAAREQLLFLWLLIINKEVQHHIGFTGFWRWCRSLELMLSSFGDSSKGTQSPPGGSAGILNLWPLWHIYQVHSFEKNSCNFLVNSNQNFMSGPWRSCESLTWHPIFGWLNLDSMNNKMGKAQKACFSTWNDIFKTMSCLAPVASQFYTHTNSGRYSFGGNFIPTSSIWHETTGHWGPWFSKILLNAWAWVTNFGTFFSDYWSADFRYTTGALEMNPCHVFGFPNHWYYTLFQTHTHTHPSSLAPLPLGHKP